ncbi:MAG: NAD(P)H-quinone oxidoreductase [Rhodospirillales bacterium]|nr:NAD(P)H-quinone oxidoreductase [Rhodospirillales bacterium]
MRVITIPKPGGPEVFTIVKMPTPKPGPEQLLVRVLGIGLNRADSAQRQGRYPMPPGIGNIPGLEISGEVEALGPKAKGFRKGDKVIALVAEGGYAEYCLVDHGLAVPMPKGWSFADGAAVIEVFLTAQETVFGLGELKKGQGLLLHAAASGVGTAALQMAKHEGATVYALAGSQQKLDKLRAMGADFVWNYKIYDFVEEVLRASKGEGVDVVEDFTGVPNMMRNIAVLKVAGRLVLVGGLLGSTGPFNIMPMFRKRLKILGFTLRAQSLANKRAIVQRFRDKWLPLLAKGTIKPVVHAALPFADVAKAHAMMDADENFGKIILTID